MINRKTWEEGLAIEREHKRTYEWLVQHVKRTKTLPDATQFYLHIVADHLNENAEYYKKLKEAEL